MAKIRGVKPEFWSDDKIVELSIPARLLFIGMWNFACDNGHIDDKPKQLKMRILPADDGVDVGALLDEIEGQGFIDRGAGTVTIHRFAFHQRPHRRWWATCEQPGCVPPEGASHTPVHSVPTVAQPLSNGRTTADGDGDGDGDGEAKTARGALELNRRVKEHPIPIDWAPTPKHIELAAERRLDVKEQAFRFRNHALANDRRQRNWNAAFANWLARATDFAPASAARKPNDARPEGW